MVCDALNFLTGNMLFNRQVNILGILLRRKVTIGKKTSRIYINWDLRDWIYGLPDDSINQTILHCLRDCEFSSNADCEFFKRFWKSIEFTDHTFFQEENLYVWLRHGIDGHLTFSFLAAVWWIWREQRTSFAWTMSWLSTILLGCTLKILPTCLESASISTTRVCLLECFDGMLGMLRVVLTWSWMLMGVASGTLEFPASEAWFGILMVPRSMVLWVV
jgi:hypothetical protein